jgi:hypothetical protein
MSNRWFGVEIEFDSGGLGMSGVANVLRDAFNRAGFRQWYWDRRMDYDGSDIELKTPRLRGNEGFEKLQCVMETLTANDCITTEADGMHVHHDAPEYISNIDACIQLVKSWKRNSHLIYRFVDSYRLGDGYDEYEDVFGYWACPQWKNDEIELFERTRMIPSYVRHDLNLASLHRHGTIEIRLHEGTLYFPEAKSWIEFGQGFIERVLRHQMYDSSTPEKLLEKIRINPDAKERLLNKARYYG